MRVQRLDHFSIRIQQVFFEDPSGVRLELDFPASEDSAAKSA